MTIIEATPQQLADVGLIIGRSALFDNRFGEPDIGRAGAWAEALAPYQLDVADALNAVTVHYRNEPQRMIMPADVIRLAREIRVDRTQREDAAARDARTAINDRKHGLVDPQLGNLPVGGADGVPAPKAYEINGAVERPCPTCGAEDYSPCINPASGVTRKMPCLARLKSAPVASDSDERLSDSLRWFRKTSSYAQADESRFEELVRAGYSKYAAARQVWPKHVPGGGKPDGPTESQSQVRAAAVSAEFRQSTSA